MPLIHTDAVHVVFTSVDDTLAAVRVAARLSKAMAAPLKLVHFRPVPYALPVDGPIGMSPIETDRFMERVRAEDIDVRVRVFLCRSARRAIPMAFRRGSIVVIGGRRRRWPTSAERLARRLETAGHFVVFVDRDDVAQRDRTDVEETSCA